MHEVEPRTIVVVGGVAGGASAAARARRCNEDARIIVFEKDHHVSFANCGMPYYIGGEIAERDKLLVAKPELFEKRFNIDIRTRHEVTAVDPETKTVEVRQADTGETFHQRYDKLILAPGASPIVPRIPGVESENVFTLRNLDDADRLAAYVDERDVKRAVVVGGGFIGLEMVEQFHRLGVRVSLVELLDQVLPPLDPEMAAPVRDALKHHWVDLHLGNGIAGIQATEGKAYGVMLSNGEEVACDLVVLGMGVRPNTALAEQAGLELGATGGIKVNNVQQTSQLDIYAVGDAVEYRHRVLGTDMRIPLAGPANRAGRVAGQHAATDHATPMAPVSGTAILRVFDRSAACTGLNMKMARKAELDARAVVVAAGNHAGYYPGAEQLMLKVVYDASTGAVLGAQGVGGAGVDKRIDVLATAIQLGATVYDVAGLDLAYAPPFGSAKDPVHMAAFAACNDLDGITPLAQLDADLSGRQVVDVRTAKELTGGRLEQATHIPVDNLRARLGELDPEQPTVVTCQVGLRGHTAARILLQHGFKDVKNLTGGMLVQQHAGLNRVVGRKK